MSPMVLPQYTPHSEDGGSSTRGEIVPLPLNKGGVYLIHYLENKFLKFASEEGYVVLGERRDEKDEFLL